MWPQSAMLLEFPKRSHNELDRSAQKRRTPDRPKSGAKDTPQAVEEISRFLGVDFNWDASHKLTDLESEKLATWRAYSKEFVQWLRVRIEEKGTSRRTAYRRIDEAEQTGLIKFYKGKNVYVVS
jgi:hypothetical protein